jgi:hypothetical protein
VHPAVIALLLAGCRMHFDARDLRDDAAGVDPDADVDADPIAARCGAGVIVCDDFESDAFHPWELLGGGGTIEVSPSCGSGGSRCARSIASTATQNARFAYEITKPVSSLRITALVTPRTAISGEAELLSLDFKDDMAVLATQVGVAVRAGVLTLYEHDFVTGMSRRTASVVAPTTNDTMKLTVIADHVLQKASLELDDVQLVTLSLTSGFTVSAGSTAILGLWVTTPTVTADFDDVDVR